jgi:hypothetical protein
MATEFCQLTDTSALSRRQAISLLSKRYGLSANEVYAALEKAKLLSVDQV